jgi:ABC-type amino acid transport substrate-binding protein
MKLIKPVLFTVLLALMPVFAKAEIVHDKAYEHIMQTKTIHCGYSDWAPFLVTNPNTHEVTGIMPEIMNEIAKRMGVKVEWTASLGWGEITSAANSGKIDMFCNTLWPDKAQLQNMSLSRPLFYTPIYVYARQGDDRFDNKYDAINDSKITIVGIDGDSSYYIMEDSFPKAKMLGLPNEDGVADQLISLTSKKGDVTLADPSIIEDFSKTNPNKIKQVKGEPLYIMNEVLVTRAGEQQLMNVINTVLYNLINEGFIDKTLQKYKITSSYPPKPDFVPPAMYKDKKGK